MKSVHITLEPVSPSGQSFFTIVPSGPSYTDIPNIEALQDLLLTLAGAAGRMPMLETAQLECRAFYERGRRWGCPEYAVWRGFKLGYFAPGVSSQEMYQTDRNTWIPMSESAEEMSNRRMYYQTGDWRPPPPPNPGGVP
jgi:hypothetical protein